MKLKTVMLDYLEQYTFLSSLFNYKLPKVQDSAVWGGIISFIANVILIMTGAFKNFSENVLGVGVAFMIMIFIIMLTDLITGIWAAKGRKEELKSKKGLRWVFKFGSYIAFIYIINCFSKEVAVQGMDWLSYPLSIIKIYVMAHIAIWEIKSIDENFESKGYSFRIFKLVTNVFGSLTKSLKGKASENGVELPDEPGDGK